MSQPRQYFYAKLTYSDKTKNSFFVYNKEKKSVNPFDYLNQYCCVKMALVIEGFYMSKTVISLQIKVHEAYIKPLKPRESLLAIKESDGEQSESEESDDESDIEKGTVVDEIKELVISDKELDE